MRNYDDLEIYHDDDKEPGNPDALLAYREYYAGRLVVREGLYYNPYEPEHDPFIDDLEGGLGYE